MLKLARVFSCASAPYSTYQGGEYGGDDQNGSLKPKSWERIIVSPASEVGAGQKEDRMFWRRKRMKTNLKFAIICSLVVLLCAASNSWALYTYAWAQSYAPSQTPSTVSDEDEMTGALAATADAYASWDGYATYSSADATAYRDPTTGNVDLDTWTNSFKQNSADSVQNYASASYGVGGAIIEGPGGWATLTLRLDNVSLQVSALNPLATATINMDWIIDGTPVYAGSATLQSTGVGGPTDYSFDGDGIYGASFFDIFFESSTQTYKANYTGLSELSDDFPAYSFFDIYFELWIQSTEPTGTGFDEEINITQDVSLLVQEGYKLVPEPATICLLGLSGLALLRRRRKA